MAPVGWGKTYYAVHRLKTVYDSKTRPIFTNINLKIPYDDFLLPFDFNDFHKFCVDEYEYFQAYRDIQSSKRSLLDDDDILQDANNPDNYDLQLKGSGLLDKYGSALIVWDECQTDLEKIDPYLLRFFTYHRHFEDMDIVLITQDISLIDRKFKRQIDEFVVGQSPSKRIFSSSFQYKIYNNHRMYAKHEKDSLSLPSKKEIFALYDSGGYKKPKTVFLKKIAPIIIMVVLLTSIWKFVIVPYVFGSDTVNIKDSIPTTTDPNSVELNSEQVALKEAVKQDQKNNEDYFIDESGNPSDMQPPPPLVNGNPRTQSNSTFFNNQNGDQQSLARYIIRFQCTQNYCYFEQNRLTIPLISLGSFFKKFGGEILTSEMINNDISVITALVPSELYQMIDTHKIMSRSENYGAHSENSKYGTSMVSNRTNNNLIGQSPGF